MSVTEVNFIKIQFIILVIVVKVFYLSLLRPRAIIILAFPEQRVPTQLQVKNCSN